MRNYTKTQVKITQTRCGYFVCKLHACVFICKSKHTRRHTQSCMTDACKITCELSITLSKYFCNCRHTAYIQCEVLASYTDLNLLVVARKLRMRPFYMQLFSGKFPAFAGDRNCVRNMILQTFMHHLNTK